MKNPYSMAFKTEMKRLIKRFIPLFLLQQYSNMITKSKKRKELSIINGINEKYDVLLRKKKDKPIYDVIFFMMVASNWKYDSVYRIIDQHPSFKPIVVIYPLLTYGEEVSMKELNAAKRFCEEHHYKFRVPWDQSKKQWIDIKNEVDPDIVFFSNPYLHSLEMYYITNFMDCLTCYVPYSIRQERIFDIKFNTFFQNIVWRNYYESDIQLDLAKEYARNKGNNVVVTGYPIIDIIRKANPINTSWKKQDKVKKRIIWAPHWTFQETSLDWSSFLIYYDFMLELALEYQSELQFSFKPHPLLKTTLSKDNLWGEDRTDHYYEVWENLPYGQLDETDYVELFASSDALIHDCGSFMIEYLAVNKPVLYLLNKPDISNRFNDFGILAYDCHYKAHSREDIKTFINSVLFKNADPLKSNRELFCEKALQFSNGYAADRIVKDICKNLNIHITN